MHDAPNNTGNGGSSHEAPPGESPHRDPAGHSGQTAHGHRTPDHDGEGREHAAGDSSGHPHHPAEVVIQIDRTPYKEAARDVTGAEIRRIPTPHIPQDRDLFEVVPGAPDRKILDNTVVHLRDGQRFFTAPGQINPGCSKANG